MSASGRHAGRRGRCDLLRGGGLGCARVRLWLGRGLRLGRGIAGLALVHHPADAGDEAWNHRQEHFQKAAGHGLEVGVVDGFHDDAYSTRRAGCNPVALLASVRVAPSTVGLGCLRQEPANVAKAFAGRVVLGELFRGRRVREVAPRQRQVLHRLEQGRMLAVRRERIELRERAVEGLGRRVTLDEELRLVEVQDVEDRWLVSECSIEGCEHDERELRLGDGEARREHAGDQQQQDAHAHGEPSHALPGSHAASGCQTATANLMNGWCS